jgi:hypothetical protein
VHDHLLAFSTLLIFNITPVPPSSCSTHCAVPYHVTAEIETTIFIHPHS